MFVYLLVRFVLHSFLQLWTSSETFVSLYIVSCLPEELPDAIQCYAPKPGLLVNALIHVCHAHLYTRSTPFCYLCTQIVENGTIVML